MVGDDNRLAVEGFNQHCLQPLPAGLVQLNGVLRGEFLLVFHTNVDEESRRAHLWFDIDTVFVELN